VTVQDSGIGMTDDELGRVFEAFSQGDHAETDSHRYGGLGLGLAISRTIVELHAGSIRAVSDGRDQGTTVLIKLPLVVDSPTIEKNSTAPVEFTSAASPSPPPEGRRVLLVEDHKPTSLAMKSLLGRRGYEVVVAGNLAEARAAIADGDFNLLICDIGLPDGDGYDLMGELRDRPGLVGLALTGYGMEQDINRSRAAGFVAHLTKPVSMAALERALSGARQQLDKR
jgi:CheY-like chemotaxis protein